MAQYILLYHLQVGSIEGMSPRDIAPLLPYSYESVTLGVTCLEDVGLCQKDSERTAQQGGTLRVEGKGTVGQGSERLAVTCGEPHLFAMTYAWMRNTPYAASMPLAHYSMLNRDREEMIMMTSKEYRAVKSADVMENPNIYDGNYIIEVWKYPVVSKMGDKSQWVDRLSLVLSLRDDDDPRVEKEVERIISEQKWKD